MGMLAPFPVVGTYMCRVVSLVNVTNTEAAYKASRLAWLGVSPPP